MVYVWRGCRHRRHESQLSIGLVQFWTGLIFTCACILVPCTLKASDRQWLKLLKVKWACVSIIQPPSNEAGNPGSLIPLRLLFMGKVSKLFWSSAKFLAKTLSNRPHLVGARVCKGSKQGQEYIKIYTDMEGKHFDALSGTNLSNNDKVEQN